MSFFNNEDIFTATETIPAIEGLQYDVDFGGAANIAMESYEDQLNIVRAIHAADIAELRCKYKIRSVQESYGDVDEAEAELQSVQEASVKEIFNAIKDAIKKLFGKIATFFKSLYDNFFVLNKSNKSFAEKYEPIITDLAGHIKEFNVLGYPYDTTVPKFANAILNMCANGIEKTEEKLKRINEDTNKSIEAWNEKANKPDEEQKMPTDDDKKRQEEDIDKIKEDLLHSIGATNQSFTDTKASFTLRAYGALRGNTKNGDKVMVKYTADKLITELKALGQIDLSVLKKIEGTMNKGFDKIIATINKAEKTYAKLPDSHKGRAALIAEANALSKKVGNVKSVNLSFISVVRSCAADFSNQVKTATVKAIAMGRDAKKSAEKKSK